MNRTALALLCVSALGMGCTDGTESSGTGAAAQFYEQTADGTGNGYAANITYDSGTDTFYVDGLGFDGDEDEGTAFARLIPGNDLALPAGFALYESPTSHPDSLTGNPIAQMEHRALYGVSGSGDTEFAIVRTGAYLGYGFGGFVYQRNGTVVLPSTGQALYSGQYVGLRDYDGQSGLEYTTGDMEVAIDFNGFSTQCTGGCASAVRGFVSNRRYFDGDGNDVTAAYLTALGTAKSAVYTEIPTLVFTVGPDVMNDQGELTGSVTSSIATSTGSETHESGTYYAVLSGDDAEEMVGVIVVTSGVPNSSSTMRETGGFLLER
ncbi:hypothetical protein [Thalassovita sp.]|uniref:hypothetical protein n=1 Tax=Thalassovita sp. TaxID=1979401 RepID=UPI0029DE6DC5|nr:hypothetical protein [Thalassovita sp.]